MDNKNGILAFVVLTSILTRLYAGEGIICRDYPSALQPAMTNYYDLRLGDSREKVIAYLGEPSGVLTSGTGEVMAYSKRGTVTLHEGKVTHFWLSSYFGLVGLWLTLCNNQETEKNHAAAHNSFKWKVISKDSNECCGVWEEESKIPFMSVFMKAGEGTLELCSSQGTNLAEIAFQTGQVDGPCKFWYSNGTAWMEGQYASGARDGFWKERNRDGTISTIEYRNRGQNIRMVANTEMNAEHRPPR